MALVDTEPATDTPTDAGAVSAASFDELLGRRARTVTAVVDIDGQTRSLRFQAIPPHELDALQSAHPVTDDEVAAWRRELDALPDEEMRRLRQAFGPPRYSTKGLTPVLIAACSLEPKLTADQVRQLIDAPGWSVAEINALFGVCLDLCTASSVAALGKGSEPTGTSGTGSATP
jgi:hypothetical protein